MLFAQKSNIFPDSKSIEKSMTETIFVHTNNTLFTTGETLYYKLNCLNPNNLKPSIISKVAHVELISNDKKSVAQQKLFLKNGTGYGDIFIPNSLKSGNYKLVCYTNWTMNKVDFSCFEIDIVIVNPFQPETKELIKTAIVTNQSQIPVVNINGDSKVSITFSAKEYTSRELVTFNLQSTENLNGNFSVSVKKVDEIASNKKWNAVAFSKTNTSSKIVNNKELIIPEFRGEIISGRITTKNEENAISGISVGLTIPGEKFQFKNVTTNSKGQFFFNIVDNYNNPEFIVQVINSKKEEYQIIIDNTSKIKYDAINLNSNNQLSQNAIASIKNRAIAAQIENAYFETKKDSIQFSSDIKPFYSSLEKDYILDAYNRFPTLLETITEVLKEAYYTKNGSQYTLGVRDYNPNRELSEPTLLLVDGILIQDANTLLDLKMETVYKVTLIQGGYYYGTNLFNGMISIITKNHDYLIKDNGTSIVKTYQILPNQEKKYYNPIYTDKTKNQRIPDYRHQLLWMPEVDLNKTISFYTSDIKGIFEITIEGFTTDGTPISKSETFEVK